MRADILDDYERKLIEIYERLEKLETRVDFCYNSALPVRDNRIRELEQKVKSRHVVILNYKLRFEKLEQKAKDIDEVFAYDIEDLKGEVDTLSVELRKVHDLALFNNDLYDDIKAVIKAQYKHRISWIEKAFKIDDGIHKMWKTDQRWHLIAQHKFAKELLKKLDGEPKTFQQGFVRLLEDLEKEEQEPLKEIKNDDGTYTYLHEGEEAEPRKVDLPTLWRAEQLKHQKLTLIAEFLEDLEDIKERDMGVSKVIEKWEERAKQ